MDDGQPSGGDEPKVETVTIPVEEFRDAARTVEDEADDFQLPEVPNPPEFFRRLFD